MHRGSFKSGGEGGWEADGRAQDGSSEHMAYQDRIAWEVKGGEGFALGCPLVMRDPRTKRDPLVGFSRHENSEYIKKHNTHSSFIASQRYYIS